jgi:hypothetical protein
MRFLHYSPTIRNNKQIAYIRCIQRRSHFVPSPLDSNLTPELTGREHTALNQIGEDNDESHAIRAPVE